MLVVTLGGIFIVSALIGVLTTGLDARIAQLRKGRSRIIERNHTVILGWSDQVFIVLAELVEANESARRPCVAILADRDKVEMEEQIRAADRRHRQHPGGLPPGQPAQARRPGAGQPRHRPRRSWSLAPPAPTTPTST